jgi:hypothetical protein
VVRQPAAVCVTGARMFFFEKKNQKTSDPLSRAWGNAEAKSRGPEESKFFCFFFFKKRSA